MGETMKFFRYFSLAATLLATNPACAEAWRSYHNDRFGATADHPAGWNMGPEPTNNDGRLFSSPDDTAHVTISGAFALDSRAEELAQRAEAHDGETVTYSAKGENWIVLSGTRNGLIFYRKALLSCHDQVWNDLDIDYPEQDKAKYDPLVAHMAASLRPGAGYNITCK
jgi:serine/threonine-protein kinase